MDNEEIVNEIEEIIELASQIDLWNIELPITTSVE